jgi:4-hydroxybenzoate polyprenyltransferase
MIQPAPALIDRLLPYRAQLGRLLGMSRIARPQKCVLAALSTLMGSYLSGAHVALWSSRVVTASLAMGLVCAFGFVVNDYCDAAADAVGKEGRPIPAGLVSPSSAVALAVLLGVGAVLPAATAGPWPALATLLLLGLSGAYSLLSFKTVPLLGIGTVAFLSAATVAYGACLADGLSPAAVAVVVCVFLNSCAMETLYTVHDLPADTRAGTPTTAVRLGPEATVWTFQAFSLLSLATLYVLPVRLGVASPSYLAAVSLVTIVPTAMAAAFVGLEYDAGRVAQARLALRVIRLAAIAPLLLLHP